MHFEMKKEELIRGKKYWVNFDDCCVSGSFMGTFRCFVIAKDNGVSEFYYDGWPEGEDPMFAQAHFDTGYVDDWAVTFEEIHDDV
jgi:hypothetical protein